jgi:hypothetical protein
MTEEEREHNLLVFNLVYKLVTAVDGNNITPLYAVVSKLTKAEIEKSLAE